MEKRLSVNISAELHKKLKTKAARNDKSIKEIVVKALEFTSEQE